MKKVYRMEDLDCANCAAKMERAIAKLRGVVSVRANFLTQRLAIEAEEEDFGELMRQVVKVCKKVEPDCKIVL